MPDWIVEEVTITHDCKKYGQRVRYRLHVKLKNLSENARDQICYWTVRDLHDPRYDLSQAKYIEPGAERFFEQENKP